MEVKSRPGMHDLDVHYADGTLGAVEVVTAADAKSIELWNLVNSDEVWVEPATRNP